METKLINNDLQNNSKIKFQNDFLISDEFLKRAGLPKIDQAFLDDFETRQPWNTARFKFFNLFRRWCMTIFALTCIWPAIFSLQHSANEGRIFYCAMALLAIIFVILLDRIFVPKAPDQKLSVQDFYAFFYDENFHEREVVLEIKSQKYKKTALKFIFYSNVFIILIGVINFTTDFNPLFGDIVAWFLAMLTACWVFYNTPYDFNTDLSNHTYWRPKISEFLKHNVAAGNYGLIFLIPYFIGPLIYLSLFPFFIIVSFEFYQIEPKNIDPGFYMLKPILIYWLVMFPIFHLFYSTTTTVGMKYISFAKEILKLNFEKE